VPRDRERYVDPWLSPFFQAKKCGAQGPRSLAPRVWLAAEAADMRCGFDRLAERVRAVIGHDPPGGHLFVSAGARRFARASLLRWNRALHAPPGLAQFPTDDTSRKLIDLPGYTFRILVTSGGDGFCRKAFFATEAALRAVLLSNSGSELRRHSRPRRPPLGGPRVTKLGRYEDKELFTGQHLELANESFAEVGDCPKDRSLLNVPC
jgi:hypothetical protein